MERVGQSMISYDNDIALEVKKIVVWSKFYFFVHNQINFNIYEPNKGER